jgi:hypothetical protein
MPAKRKKASSAREKSSNALVKNQKIEPSSPSSASAAAASTSLVPLTPAKPSSYEDRAPPPPSISETWPRGTDGLKRILKTRRFCSLLRDGSQVSWEDAIRIVQDSKAGEIDCCWLPDVRPWNWWLYPPSDTDAKVVYDMYFAIRRAFNPADVEPQLGQAIQSRQNLNLGNWVPISLTGMLSVAVGLHLETDHLLPICNEMKGSGEFPERSAVQGIVEQWRLRSRQAVMLEQKSFAGLLDEDGIACHIIRMLPTDGRDGMYELLNGGPNLLSIAWKKGAASVIQALLEHLPVLDLDIPWETGSPLGHEIGGLIDAAREWMKLYRRDRGILVQQTVGRAFPFDILELIRAYGEARVFLSDAKPDSK